ncbi:serine/threonine-protein kinase [Arsukibacterium sp. UBA3155]|uniref:serine/threonine-protein kinase n=1 Tax=Arsukibacterium sp. UBA3155 TaxID=1946058 RepID=UPI0025C0B3FB|nr:serine/threonine-protein kinase [Arsukibacterium sp. UBA3155]
MLVNGNDVTQTLSAVTGNAIDDILVDRFKLVALLGNGSNGSVFLAEDMHLGCQIALKILHNTFLHNTNTIDKVRQEILLARTISHPNVIRVHDFYLAESCAFFTMDYIEGCSLAEFRLDELPDPVPTAEKLGLQLIDAVEAIHQQGILHCDISPQNILIDKQQRLYLLDLGLASALSEVTHQCCTPAYSAPEVLQNASHSKTSDYYALAATLLQLLTNKLPFNQAELAEQLTVKLQSKIELTDLAKPFARWRRFFIENLAAYPQQRCQDVSALRQLWLGSPDNTTSSIRLKLTISMLSIIVISVMLWFGFNQQSLQQEQSSSSEQQLTMPLAMAILPATVQQTDPQHVAIARLVEQVIKEQLRTKNIRVIPYERVATTLQHLGFSQPLTEKQLQDLASLLGADAEGSPRI